MLESAKEFLEFLCKKSDKKTREELAKYQTIASLFIKNTRAAQAATEALAGIADAAAEATSEGHKGKEASSRAKTARRSATAAAEAAAAVLDHSFLEGYNDGVNLVGPMWPEIDAFGIQLAVFIAMDRWSLVNDKDPDRKLRDGILGNIPSELLQLHPERGGHGSALPTRCCSSFGQLVFGSGSRQDSDRCGRIPLWPSSIEISKTEVSSCVSS